MSRQRFRCFLWVLAVPFAVGCNGMAPTANIVGDWFICQSASCTYLGYDGWRYREDGTTVVLVAPGDRLEETELYCEHPTLTGRYTFDGLTVTETSASGTPLWYTFEVIDETEGIARRRLDVSGYGDWITYYIVRVLPPRSFGVCPSSMDSCGPVSCPNGCCWNSACQSGASQDRCGAKGAACVFCAMDKVCLDHQCK